MKIELKRIKKTYTQTDGRKAEAVRGVSLFIPEGGIFGIIGRSGAGKSSLIRVMSLLEKPDEGEVLYDGARVDNLSEKELLRMRKRIGMIFQNFNLFSSRSAAANIAYPLEIAKMPREKIRERVKEMLSLVGLSEKASSPVSALSGGQKQRIAIARALSAKPSVLFCDEATSALDPETTKSILSLIREIKRTMNLTVVMITHQMEVVRDACENVAVIDAGEVRESGSVESIFMQPESLEAKSFVKGLQANDGAILRWSEGGGRYLLRFLDEKTSHPVISETIKKYDVVINVLGGGIQHLKESKVGTLVVDITGNEAEEAKRYISSLGVRVEDNND